MTMEQDSVTMQQRIVGLKRAAPYLRMYKGKIFVVKIGGEIIEDKAVLDNFSEQVALLHRLGIHVVLVHGGGALATELATKLGIPVEMVNGRRITNAETLEVAKMVFNKLNTDLLASLRKYGVYGVGLSGIDGGLIHASKRPVKRLKDAASGEERDVDFGFVGDVSEVNPSVIHHLIGGEFIPVISSLAGGEENDIYNVNADTIAVELTIALNAEKLILMTGAPGVLKDAKDPSTLISHMTLAELDDVIAKSAKGGMVAKLQACSSALKRGVPRVHIISGVKADSLLVEIFTNEGSGTLIEVNPPLVGQDARNPTIPPKVGP
jgi:acetylglutamate kinase